MNSKTQRITAAKQTLQAFENGFYEVDGLQMDLTQLHKNSLNNIILYTPELTDNIKLEEQNLNTKTQYKLSSLPVVSALVQLKEEGKSNIGILNFASAKNPGGGFLNGALAQEESLALCSNLYLTQIKKQEYYEKNRCCNTMLYTNHMIYSKDIVFIREDCRPFWKSPLTASVLTAPAVNMGQYILKGNTDMAYAEKVMKDRMRKVLQVFAEQKNEVLILGAYGCGVFRNDPKTVANFFVELLAAEGFEKYFSEIMFAVHDSSKTKSVYRAFEHELSDLVAVEEDESVK